MTERKRPVTFREVFAVREYRAIYFSLLVNWVGDYLARAAIAVLVYQQSHSVLLSAASFAINFLPWVVGGALLSALADRYPYRTVLITCDLSRMVLIGLLLIPHLPIWVMLVLLFVASLGAPPTQAARSALLPLLMKREQMPMAIATNATTTQSAQVVGYLAGAALATAINPQFALLIDVVTFALSASLIASGVRSRPAARERNKRAHLLQESAEGFRLVFGRETLRSIAILIFVLTMFAIVPEGLAAAWAAQGDPDSATRGLNQGLIMAAGPIGFVIGGLFSGRLVGPEWRERLIRPLAVLSTLILVPALIGPPPPLAAVLVALSGIAQGGLSPTLNSKFVLILPHGFRARAFGVMQTGLQLSQFVGVMATGWLANEFKLPLVVGVWSIGGTALMALLIGRWPSRQAFQLATDDAAASILPHVPRHAAPPTVEAAPEHHGPPRHSAETSVSAVSTSVTPERT
ncbi:MFS transporter [Actinoplanes sp. NPDC051411]|uniref:MFS transporter n=1 Tax=Actinoplanes sp. NPDC051411 TaxID=3155522 RepID=UPI003417D85B